MADSLTVELSLHQRLDALFQHSGGFDRLAEVHKKAQNSPRKMRAGRTDLSNIEVAHLDALFALAADEPTRATLAHLITFYQTIKDRTG